jgi:hypothetical protein
MGLIIDLGGNPQHDRIGFRYWNPPNGPLGYYLIKPSAQQATLSIPWVLEYTDYRSVLLHRYRVDWGHRWRDTKSEEERAESNQEDVLPYSRILYRRHLRDQFDGPEY